MRRTDTFWFSDTPGVVKSTSWGNTIERVCTWAYFEDREGPAFYLYNVHLDHQSQPSRERSVALLLERIRARDPKAPAVVTGDFNAGERQPGLRGHARPCSGTASVFCTRTRARPARSTASSRVRPPATRSTSCSSNRASRCSTPPSCGHRATGGTRRTTSR
ncbi:MAG: hypothetical protein MZV70_42585 [Desulfobacterales bacterium]|nr:hypothetical protein [Desulfobacterales bacterium]